MFEDEDEEEENTIFGKSKTRTKQQPVVEPVQAPITVIDLKKKAEEEESLMKKSTFNDDALFKKKNTASIFAKKVEPKKNIFDN
jgi:hypothetical protein